MLKRIISVLTVMAIMAAMLAVTAVPAFAQVPPNCEIGQAQAAFNAVVRMDFGQFFKHAGKFTDCDFGNPPGEGQ